MYTWEKTHIAHLGKMEKSLKKAAARAAEKVSDCITHFPFCPC